jgi:peptidyl-prolyl cis-trans isomerase D
LAKTTNIEKKAKAMLQNIRNHVQGWIAGAIVAIISITFALFGIQYYIGNESADGATLAKVGDVKVSAKAFVDHFNSVVRSQPKLAVLTGQPRQTLKQEVLTQMIQHQALLAAVLSDGFSISDGQLRALIMSEPMFQESGAFSRARFQQLLYANNLTEQQYYQRLRQQLVIGQVASGLESSAFVLPGELAHTYSLLNQKRSLGYFIVPSSLFSSIKPTEAELKKAYKNNQAALNVPEEVSIHYILLSPKTILKTITVSDSQIKTYYDDNSSSFMSPRRFLIADISEKSLAEKGHLTSVAALAKMKDIEAALKKGAAFASFTAHKTLWVSAGKAAPKMLDALSKLKPGQNSGLFATKSGYHIVRLVSTQAPVPQPLSAVKDRVKKVLAQQQAENILSAQADKLSNLTYTNPSSLAPAAKALGIKVQTTTLFSKSGEKSGILSNMKIVNTAFGDDVLMQGNNSNPIDLKNGGMLVLRVNKHIPSHVPRFKDVKSKLIGMTKLSLAQKKAKVLAAKIQAALANGEKPATLAAHYKVIWNYKANVQHNDSSVPETVLNDAFYLPYDKKDKAKNVQVAAFKNGDYVVIDLLSVTLASASKIDASTKSSLSATIEDFQGKMAYQLFTKSAVDASNVKINHAALKDAN